MLLMLLLQSAVPSRQKFERGTVRISEAIKNTRILIQSRCSG